MHKSIVDNNDKFTDYFAHDYIDYIKNKIKCINVGKVNKYDANNNTATVQLLPKDDDNNDIPPITEVIVPKYITDTTKTFDKIQEQLINQNAFAYHKVNIKRVKHDSIVIVGFNDSELDNYNGKTKFKVESNRKHELTDAIILGVIDYG